jgi:hypothetical protein
MELPLSTEQIRDLNFESKLEHLRSTDGTRER